MRYWVGITERPGLTPSRAIGPGAAPAGAAALR